MADFFISHSNILSCKPARKDIFMGNFNNLGGCGEHELTEIARAGATAIEHRYPPGIAAASAELVSPELAAAFVAANMGRFPHLFQEGLGE